MRAGCELRTLAQYALSDLAHRGINHSGIRAIIGRGALTVTGRNEITESRRGRVIRHEILELLRRCHYQAHPFLPVFGSVMYCALAGTPAGR